MEKKDERKGTYNNKGMKQETTAEDIKDDEIGRINYVTDDCDDDGAAAADDDDYDNDDQQ